MISSLDQLMRLNNVGFKFRNDWDKAIDCSSEQLFGNNNLPIWLLLAGEHGEFELLFTIPAEKKLDFLKEASHLYLKPIYLGETTKDQNISLNLYNQDQSLNTEKIRNLTFEKDFSPSKYLQKLLEIDTYFKNA